MSAKIWQRFAVWAIRCLLFALLLLIFGAVTVLTVLPKAVHGEAMTVLTGSMTPTIPVGSIVLVRPVDPGTLHVGDVATYQKAPGKADYITHRIVEINTKTTPTTFTFKGDANRGPDLNPVPATAIRGKVWFHVAYLGAIRDMMHTGNGITGIAMLVLGGYALSQGAGHWRDRRAAMQGQDDRPLAPVEIEAPKDTALAEPLLIQAVVPRHSLDGLTPRVFSLLVGGLLLDETNDEITLLIAQPAGRAAVTAEMLRQFDATRIEVSHTSVASAASDEDLRAPRQDSLTVELESSDA